MSILLVVRSSDIAIVLIVFFFFFQAEDGIRDLVRSRGLGDVYKRQMQKDVELAKLASFHCSTNMDLIVWRNQVSSWVLQTNEELAGVWLVPVSYTHLTLPTSDLV